MHQTPTIPTFIMIFLLFDLNIFLTDRRIYLYRVHPSPRKISKPFSFLQSFLDGVSSIIAVHDNFVKFVMEKCIAEDQKSSFKNLYYRIVCMITFIYLSQKAQMA